MTYNDHWQTQLPDSLAEFARLSPTVKDIDLTYGLLATAILWPIRRPIQDYDGDAIDALREITGPEAKHVLKAMQGWPDDPLAAARSLATQAQANHELQTALTKLNEHFNVRDRFAAYSAPVIVPTQGDGATYNITDQIKAATVHIGGETHIQSQIIQIITTDRPAPETPKPEIPPLPYEPETIPIPAGPFWMGSLPGDNVPACELPQHQLHLPTYCIGKYPVTNAQYAAFIKQTKRLPPQKVGWLGPSPPKGKLDHPVAAVSWHDAQAYGRWLCEKTGRPYRLPSEAEWEKAARGDDGRIYPWGNAWEAARCHCAASQTAPVTAHPAGQSLWGCYDMVGNVWEWTSTAWGQDWQCSDFPYPYRSDDGREELTLPATVYRLLRGGDFGDKVSLLRCCARRWYAPEHANKTWGFRVAMTIS